MQRKKLINLMLIGSMLSAMIGITPAWARPTPDQALARACLTPVSLQRLKLTTQILQGWHEDSRVQTLGQHITVELLKNHVHYDTIHIYEKRGSKGPGCLPTTTSQDSYGTNKLPLDDIYFVYLSETR